MLKLSFVSNVSNATVTYDADLTYFSYNVKNNEMLTFTATVPTLSATLKLVTTDAHLEAIKRGDELKVQNADGTGIELVLRAVEVSQIPRKGEMEIACSGPFIEKTNEVWGTLLIPAGTLSSTKTQYGLSVLKPLQDSNNAEMFVNVDKKSDLLLGISWSYPEPRNLAVMPFVGGGRAAGPASVGEGIAMFKDRKPGETYTPDEYASEMSAPVYAVDAEDIIDYDISPAQPPVTHLRTSALGKLGPTPQIPPVQVLKRSGTPGSEDIHDSVRAYYVQGKSLAALWVAQEDTAGNLVSQTLYWSDGVSQTWVGGSRKQIIGIFDNAYIEVYGTSGSRVYDRVTDSLIATLSYTASSYTWGSQTVYLPGTTFCFNKATDTGATIDDQLFILPEIRRQGSSATTYNYAVRKRGATYSVIGTTIPDPALLTQTFAGACRVHHLPGNALSIFYSGPVSYPHTYELSTSLLALRVTIGESTVTASSAMMAVSYTKTGSTLHNALFMGAVDTDSSTLFQSTFLFLRLEYTPTGGTRQFQCLRVDVENQSLNITTSFDADRLFWVVGEWDAFEHWYDYPVLKIKGDSWQLLALAQPTASVWQEGSISEWSGEPITFFSLVSTAFVGKTYKGDGVWEVYLQLSELPFITRQQGILSQSTQIAAGETNIFDLKFKVGAVQQTGQFDAEKGRIRLKIAGFSKNHFVMHAWHEFQSVDIEHLNTMAVGAYVRIRLDPSNPADTIVGKVVSWSTSYDGIVKAELVAIIVS